MCSVKTKTNNDQSFTFINKNQSLHNYDFYKYDFYMKTFIRWSSQLVQLLKCLTLVNTIGSEVLFGELTFVSTTVQF